MTSARKPKVLIIGGGLSGLTLAQMLRKYEIPFEIFERDDDDHSRIQGWALSLGPVLQTYREKMPKDIPEVEKASVTYNVPELGATYEVLDGDGERIVSGVGYIPPGSHGPGNPHGLVRANRASLRRLLSTHLNVNWNKRFLHYKETEDGVTAHFQDGTSATGDILVGADGANSRVRHQLLGSEAGSLLPIPVTLIIGQVHLEKEALQRQLDICTCMYVVQAATCRLFASYRDLADDLSSGNYYWLLSFEDEAAMRPDYWMKNATKQEMLDKAMAVSANVPGKYRELLEMTPIEGIYMPHIQLKEFYPKGPFPRGRVTIMGDAAHTMTPFRGIGCNTAMEDTFDLADAIARGFVEGTSIPDVLQAYEKIMIPRGFAAVVSSNVATFRRDATSQAELLKNFAKGRYDIEKIR